MIAMARKHSEEELDKTRLWEIKQALGIKGAAFYAALKLEDMSLSGFLNYMHRPPPPELLRKAETYYKRMTEGGVHLESRGGGFLKVIASVGAGGNPDFQSDAYELNVPIEFSRAEWRGMVIDQDGSSMMPYLHPGDTIVIKPQIIVKLGKFMVIRNEANPTELFVKKVEFDGSRFYFKSLNPKSQDIVAEGYIPVGFVVGIISADESVKIGPVEVGIDEEFIHRALSSRLP